MKKIFSTLCMALVAVAMMGQQPVITFEKTVHDFGKINEGDGKVTTVFTFKNEGMTPLIISKVQPSCSCTAPSYTKEPVEPGQTGTITVTYNPSGHGGQHFNKSVTITSNATEPTKRIFIKGEVIKKEASPEHKYKLTVGDLRMKARVLDLGTITKGESKSGELEYANLTEGAHQVALATNSQTDAYLATEATIQNVQPKEVGKFLFTLDSKHPKLYGPVEAPVYVVVDGKQDISEPFLLTIKANIVEDFSNLTIEQKQQAPIIETAAEQNVGTIAAGKSHKFLFPVKNSGLNPLEIRRVYSTDKSLTIKQPKAVKSGKKGAVSVDINAKELKPGNYSREIIIICNDYLHPIQKVQINFTVE